MPAPDVQPFYHQDSGTLSYVVSDPASRHAAVIDPVLGFDIVSGNVDLAPLRAIVAYLEQHQLKLCYILETHAHADHLSAASMLQSASGGSVAIGEGIRDVQAHFGNVFNLKAPFHPDGRQFDRLLGDGEQFVIGNMQVSVMATPGHTSDSVTYLVENCAFVGDSLFMPDAGTARCDFPGGDAGALYDSIQKILALPADTRLFMCHDYGPGGREYAYETTVAKQAADNIHVGGQTSRDDFIALRENRDSQLSLPRLILPSIQVNIRAGELPAAEDNSVSYLKIPLNLP